MGSYIYDSISSVLTQTFQDFELIVVDNCSDDKSWLEIEKFSDDRIRKFRQVSNLGMYANLNVGIMLAKGKYIKIHCSDDILHKECLSVLNSFIEHVSNVSSKPLYLGHNMSVGSSFDLIEKNWQYDINQKVSNFRKSNLISGIATGLPNVCVNTRAFQDFGGFGSPNPSKDFSRDLLMLGLFSAKCECYQTDLSLVFERSHEGQNRYSLKKQWQLNEIYKLYSETNLLETKDGILKLKELGGKHLASSLKYLIKKRSFSYLIHTLKFSASKKLLGIHFFKTFFTYSLR